QRGARGFLAVGTAGAIVTSLIYTVVDDLVLLGVIVLLEALSWALVSPALYAIVAAGTPAGRSSTAQGIFGAAGTLAYIVSAAISGQLLATDFRGPFYALATVAFATLLIALAIAGRTRLDTAEQPQPAEPAIAA